MSSHSRESNQNLIYNEVKNLSRRLNEFSGTIQAIQEAQQDNALDIEQLTIAVEQLKNRLQYLETILKELSQ